MEIQLATVFSRRSPCPVDALIQAGYRYACALQPDTADAQDLVHEAWLKINKRHGSQPDKPLLFRSIRNLYIDQYRRAQTVKFSAADDMGVSAEDQMGAADVAELPDARLHRALACLRDEEREALFLSVVEGYTAQEIAELTGTVRGTVLSLIHRSRLKLKKLIADDNVMPFPRRQDGAAS